MSASQKPDFKSHQIVPDVLDEEPTHVLSVSFGKERVSMGNELSVAATQKVPTLDWPHDSAKPESLYTVLMVDPDAPSRQDHKFRNWLHWMVVNAPGAGNLEKMAHTVVPFEGPAPPDHTGLHRYVFLVYQQKGHFDTHKLSVPQSRASFSLSGWLKHNQNNIVHPPVAGNFFQCQHA